MIENCLKLKFLTDIETPTMDYDIYELDRISIIISCKYFNLTVIFNTRKFFENSKRIDICNFLCFWRDEKATLKDIHKELKKKYKIKIKISEFTHDHYIVDVKN